MGWSLAPYICQSFATAILSLIISPSVPLLDDWLILSTERGKALKDLEIIKGILVSINATIHPNKTDKEEKTLIEFNGIEWDLQTKCHRLCSSFVSKWLPWLSNSLLLMELPLRFWLATVSVCLYVIRVLCLDACNYFMLFRWISRMGQHISLGSLSLDSISGIWTDVRSHIAEIKLILEKNCWVQFWPMVKNPLLIYTDSSLSSWAYCYGKNAESLQHFHGFFRFTSDINTLECFAVYKAVQFLCSSSSYFNHWFIFCDNLATVYQINKLRSRSYYSNLIIQRIVSLLRSRKSKITLIWTSSETQLADKWTRLCYEKLPSFPFLSGTSCSSGDNSISSLVL